MPPAPPALSLPAQAGRQACMVGHEPFGACTSGRTETFPLCLLPALPVPHTGWPCGRPLCLLHWVAAFVTPTPSLPTYTRGGGGGGVTMWLISGMAACHLHPIYTAISKKLIISISIPHPSLLHCTRILFLPYYWPSFEKKERNRQAAQGEERNRPTWRSGGQAGRNRGRGTDRPCSLGRQRRKEQNKQTIISHIIMMMMMMMEIGLEMEEEGKELLIITIISQNK